MLSETQTKEVSQDIHYDKYYQSESIWIDENYDKRFKLTFGFFSNKEDADNFHKDVILSWADGKFFIKKTTGKDKSLLSKEDITYADGTIIDSIEKLYPEYVSKPDPNFLEEWGVSKELSIFPYGIDELEEFRDARYKYCFLEEAKTIEQTIKFDIHQAYKELWRFAYNIVDNLAEAVYNNGKPEERHLKRVGSSMVDHAVKVWEENIKLISDDFDESYACHNEKISKTVELLNIIFKKVDKKETHNTIKYGQSSICADFRSCNHPNSSLLNGKYIFKDY